VLQLDRETEAACAADDLLVEVAARRDRRRATRRWQARARRRKPLASSPPLRVETVTTRSIALTEAQSPQRRRGRWPSNPSPDASAGGRTESASEALVHATLAEIPLKATPDEIARAAERKAGSPELR